MPGRVLVTTSVSITPSVPTRLSGYLTPAEVFTSTPVEAASGAMIEFLASDPLRIAEPNLNVAPVLS